MGKNSPKIVGIIGGIASGKSTISKLFAKLGAMVIDADRISHMVLNREKVKSKLNKIFGDTIINKNGNLNREVMANMVFASKERMKKLNRIVHPLIRKEIDKKVAIADEKDMIVVDAALLCESGYTRKCDKVVFIKTPLKIRSRRSCNKGWGRKEVTKREQFQLPMNKKIKFADYIIDNSKTVNYAFEQVKEIYSKILN